MNTNRRTFIQSALVAAAVPAILPGTARAQAEAPKLKGRIKQGMVRGLLGNKPIEETCRTMKELGLVCLDFTGRGDWPVMKEHGIAASIVGGAGSIKDGLNNAAKRDDWLKQFRTNIAAAAEFGWKRVLCMAGDRAGISDADGMNVCVSVLKEAVKIANDHDVTLCMELLNSKVDHPGYMCDRTAWGVEMCKRVESPRMKLLYDIYHMQIMEGDIIRTIRDNIAYIGHFHTAGNPGRKDLDEDQEMYYPAIMRTIAKLQEEGKYDGYVVHEFGAKNGIESLRKAIQVCDV